MSRHSESARLQELEAFGNLSEKEIRKVADAGTYLHLPANWSLMSESTPADKAYVLLSGEVEVRQHGQAVATVGAGGIIGEVGILEKRLRTASVISRSELEVVHFTKEKLSQLVEEVPALKEVLVATAEAYPDHE
jgi:CRP/FNR family transcriptional regulator, cyclic AMP receptor protein